MIGAAAHDPCDPCDACDACAGLVALAQRELALVEAGAADELDAVHAERVRLLDVLDHAPVPLGLAEQEQLRDAARLQQLAGEAMRQHREAIGRELGHSAHARRAVAGYRAGTAT